MTKKEVLEINVNQYRNLNYENCPDYSVGFEHSSEHCNFIFYCKGDTCSTKDDNSLIYLQEGQNNTESYIVDVCHPNKVVFGGCYQAKECMNDNECLSNRCLENKCITNEDLPVIKCMDIYYYDYLRFRNSAKMHCGYTDNEECKTNGDCASNECNDGICITTYQDHKYNFLFSSLSIVLVSIVILIFIVFTFTFCCKRMPFIVNKKQKLKSEQGRVIKVRQINNDITIEEIKCDVIDKTLICKNLNSSVINILPK